MRPPPAPLPAAQRWTSPLHHAAAAGSLACALLLLAAGADPRALDALVPDWRERGCPVAAPVAGDDVYFLRESGQFRLPFLLGRGVVDKQTRAKFHRAVLGRRRNIS